MSNENYAKINCLSKMKELNQIVLQEGLFASITGHLRLTKGHLDNPEGEVEVEFIYQIKISLRITNLSFHSVFFFNKGTVNEASDNWMLYLSYIVPGYKNGILAQNGLRIGSMISL